MSTIVDAMERARERRGEQAAGRAADGARGTTAAAGTGGTLAFEPFGAPPSGAPQGQPAGAINIESPRLVAANDYSLPVAEEYRKFKSAVIRLTSGPKPLKTLLVTSSVGGEGKSVTSLNLALSLAQEYDQRVLLIDADLRSPSICRYLGLKRLPGLSDCLLGEKKLDEVLVNTGLGNLLLLPAGHEVKNPVEILASRRMQSFLDALKRRYAGYYIIFDISPALPFAEARVIANLVEGVIFVVKEGGTSAKNVSAAIEALGPANLLGLVYNKATAAGLAGGYNYYYCDYDYRQRDGETAAAAGLQGLWKRLLGRGSTAQGGNTACTKATLG